MKVQFHPAVFKFIRGLDAVNASDLYDLIELLEAYGHELGMPFAKPIGGKLWELRSQGRPAFRVIYAFHDNEIVLLLALKKVRPALRRQEVELARKRYVAYCAQ